MAHRVLLTGVNGFIGSHILEQLLAAGSTVRGIVRSPDKAEAVRKDFPSAGERLELAIVPDMTITGAYDSAVLSEPPFDIAIHTASPFNYSVVKSPRDFIEPAFAGTT